MAHGISKLPINAFSGLVISSHHEKHARANKARKRRNGKQLESKNKIGKKKQTNKNKKKEERETKKHIKFCPDPAVLT